MKKIISGVLALILVFGVMFMFSSCAGEETQKLICGVTKFEPMNYLDDNGEWTGFDTEFALLVGEKLGMEVEFQEIEWDQKYSELAAGSITCIWNGFTANSSEKDGTARSELVDFTYSYMNNKQCVVAKADKADVLKTKEDLAGKTIAAESGSAGDSAANALIGDNGTFIGSDSQISTLTEVNAGSVDCTVIDVLLANEKVGSGDYTNLVILDIELESEVYAVGFKKGSDLTQKVNDAMKELKYEGKLEELAKKYNLENYLNLEEFIG